MKISMIIWGIVLGVMYCLPAFGQDDFFMSPSSEERNFLPDGRWSRIQRMIDKGKEELQKAESARETFESAQNSDDVHAVRLEQLRERIYRHQLSASTYFEDAHRLQYRLLRHYLKKEKPYEYNQIEDQVREQFQQGSVLRRRAMRVVPGNSPVRLMERAAGHETRALDTMVQLAMADIRYQRAAKQMRKKESLTMVEITEKADTLKPESLAVVKRNKPEAVGDETKNKEGQKEIFFSIQFLATRQPLSDQRVKLVYNGHLPVIESEGEGWFRFSAGRFATVEKALDEKEREGIYGFIVAYRNGERISLTRAREYIKSR
jgi:hypothetical protein